MPSRRVGPAWLRAAPALLLLGYGALTVSLLVGGGLLVPNALAALLLSIALITYAALRANWSVRIQPRRTWVVAVALLGLLNLFHLGGEGAQEVWLQASLVIAMTATAAAAAGSDGRWRWWLTALCGVLWLGLVAVTWPAWGKATIDVFGAVTGATSALFHGHNPYAPIFPFLVHISPFVAAPKPGHLPYGPIVPLIYAPGWAVGDIRVMNVVAVLLIAAGLGRIAARQEAGALAHRVFLLALISPLNISMIQNAWVEIYIAAGIVWWLALRETHVKTGILALSGALMVTLLTVPLILPFWLWSPRARREIGLAVAIAVAITVPFAVMTGPGQFAYDIVGFILSMPPWYNSLTLTSFVWQTTGITLPGWVMLLLALCVVLVSIRLGPPSRIGTLALEGALFLALPMLVSKMAFFNFYFLAGAMILLALAGPGQQRETEVFALPRISLRGRAWLSISPGYQ